MAPKQLKPTAEMGFFLLSQLPPQPPFPGDSGSPSGQGYFGNEKNGLVEDQECSKDHESGGQSKLCARGHWRPAEDAKLKELVSQNGPQNWNLIAEKLEGRSGKSCRLRWFNQLDPRINRKAFTEEEEDRLLAAHRAYGNKWALITRLFPGRTDNAVKNHWHVITARKHREQSSAYRRRKPSTSSFSPPSSQPFIPKRMEGKTRNNACSGESTITSNRDESVSACTDLSPNSNNGRVIPCFLARNSPTQQPSPFDFLMGCPGKLVAARNECYEEYGHSGSGFHQRTPIMLDPGVDQSCSSDYNSEASAAESVAVHMNNSFLHGKRDRKREKISLPFIDFLGVGAT